MRAHTRKTMKHEQENMKELLKKKYFSPLIESYDMVGEKILDGSNDKVSGPGFTPGGGVGNERDAKLRNPFGYSYYDDGYENE